MFYLSQSELILHLLLTAGLFGMIWILQNVHYPSFKYIAEEKWSSFMSKHRTSTSLIMGSLMFCELALCAWLAGKNGFRTEYFVPLMMVLAIWLSTFFIQVPILNGLQKAKDEALINRLVWTNWIRTLLWTVKMIWVSWQAYIHWI